MVSKAKPAPASDRPGKPTNEDKAKAWSDYQAEVRAVREKSARLKELRLASEAEGERAKAKAARSSAKARRPGKSGKKA